MYEWGTLMNSNIFREYDIRGKADVDFDSEFAYALGRAYGTLATEKGGKTVSVGRDCRLTSPKYAAAVISGLKKSGLQVLDIGICPTPLLYFSLYHYDLDGGIQVTGSHNPSDQNGFKICLGKTSLHGPEIQELRRRIERGNFTSGNGQTKSTPITTPYHDFLVKKFGRLEGNISVVVDAGNSTAGPVAPQILRALGCRVTELFCDLDGRFPNHHPDPTVPENVKDLIAKVKDTQAQVGVAYDGDADRLGLIDRNGNIVWGDEMLILFARDLLTRHPKATVVAEVKCSQRLYDDIQRKGGRPIMWKAGHSLIKAKMKQTGALLGGEMSGHMFFADEYFGYDDGIYASCQVLKIMSQTGKELHELLEDLPSTFITPEIRISCPDDLKFAVVERVRVHFGRQHEVVNVDGVRVRFPDGWGLVRASNTQPALVLRVEASSRERLGIYRTLVESSVADAMLTHGISPESSDEQ